MALLHLMFLSCSSAYERLDAPALCVLVQSRNDTGLTLDFRISACCRGRGGFRTLVCHSRSHPSPKCTLLPFYIPNLNPFFPDPSFVPFSTLPSFVLLFCVHPLMNQFPSSNSACFHHPRNYSQC